MKDALKKLALASALATVILSYNVTISPVPAEALGRDCVYGKLNLGILGCYGNTAQLCKGDSDCTNQNAIKK